MRNTHRRRPKARLRPLDIREQEIRASLDSRRAEIIEVLAQLAACRTAHAAGPAGAAGRRSAIAANRHAARIGGA